jgi:hypothetical protein
MIEKEKQDVSMKLKVSTMVPIHYIVFRESQRVDVVKFTDVSEELFHGQSEGPIITRESQPYSSTHTHRHNFSITSILKAENLSETSAIPTNVT